MKKKSFWIIISLLLLSLYLNISLGDAKININSIIFSWFNSNIDINLIDKTILEDIRIPRALMAILIGAVLATSGTVMQAVFRNPLADPGLIGVSSGGAVGAIFFITILSNLNLKNSELLSDFGMIAFPMIGSILATFLVFKLSQYNKRTNVATMLLIGLAINAIAGAIIGFATYMSNDDQLRTFTFWSLGSLGVSNWKIIITLIPLCVAVIFLKICMKKELNLFLLGEYEAHYLGVDVEKIRKKLIIITSGIVGLTVSLCGMIGFIGLVTPHICRLIFGPNHKYLLPSSALIGGLILCNADLFSRILIPYSELPIGVVTSLIGAPFFLYLIIQSKKRT